MSKNNNGKLPSVKNKTSTSVSNTANKKQEASKSSGENKLPATPAKSNHQESELVQQNAENPPPMTDDNKEVSAISDSSSPVVPVEISSLISTSSSPAVVNGEATKQPEPETIPQVPQNGKVTLVYEQYNEQFDIVNGSTTHENIDEVYCLSFVMPGCLIHLSKHSPTLKRQLEIDERFDDLFLKEDPRGTYHGLEVDQTYYAYVEQEAEQLARDQAITKQRLQSLEGGGKNGKKLEKDDGRVLESCSCIYGNPCVDEYGCKDWSNRCAVATQNGWKGF
jgi:hypothetical protein